MPYDKEKKKIVMSRFQRPSCLADESESELEHVLPRNLNDNEEEKRNPSHSANPTITEYPSSPGLEVK